MMSISQSRRSFILSSRTTVLSVLGLALLAIGCKGPAAYKAPVSKFRDASAVVIESTKAYLTTLNKTERDGYIYQQVEFRRPIKIEDLNRVQVFSDESIAARLKALDQLSNYTELLYQLANSEAPASIKSKASDLQTSLTNLSGEVNKLTGDNDTGFKSAAGKVFPVLGEVLQAFVNKKIEDAIKLAVAKGTQPVNDLIDAIKIDVETAYERRRSAFSGRRTAATLEYNREFEKGKDADPEKLRAYADAISAIEDRAEALRTAQPVQGLDAMKKANEALEKFAKTPKVSVEDFQSFNDAMEAFANAAKRVGDGVQALKK